MIRSLFSAVSGLRGHQTMLDVIGNNIANVNTSSFKSSRVIFSDLYYQTLAGASAPTATAGGTNPTQIGYGSLVSSIDVVNTRSSFQQTSRALDVYIAGEGYFTVQDAAANTRYTRLGSFSFDSQGTLIDSEGNRLMGMMPSLSNPVGTLVPLTIENFDQYTNIAIQNDGTITGTNTTTNTIDTLGQLALAVFQNPSGLLQQGTSYYSDTVNSGTPAYVAAASPTAGSLVTGGLEMSNVDLSKEFTDMIIAQRGFQANARVITTSDQVLEELVNLKR